MKERPILMSAPMVRACMRKEGPKTVTRRIVKPQPVGGDTIIENSLGSGWLMGQLRDSENAWRDLWCPYGKVGDRLWVREAWSPPYSMTGIPPRDMATDLEVWYWADGNYPTHGDWTRPKPSIHMPRWASRLTLEITEVRAERLQDITAEQAIAEGLERINDIRPNPWDLSACWKDYAGSRRYWNSPIDSFHSLWESINGAESWALNPYVFAVSFKRVKPQ